MIGIDDWAYPRNHYGTITCDLERRRIVALLPDREQARLTGMGRDHLTKADTVTVAAVKAGVPGSAEALNPVGRFQAKLQTKTATELDGWIEQTWVSLIAPLARGV